MFKVVMENECSCFKKSEYENNKTFQKLQDAQNYAKLVTELMNEEFCGKHSFYTQRFETDCFLIRSEVGTGDRIGSSCSTIGKDGWSLESTQNSCGTGCGCS